MLILAKQRLALLQADGGGRLLPNLAATSPQRRSLEIGKKKIPFLEPKENCSSQIWINSNEKMKASTITKYSFHEQNRRKKLRI